MCEATGIDLEFVGCRNNISGQVVFVTLNPGDTTWDCAAAGLSFSSGESVDVSAQGTVNGEDVVGASMAGGQPISALCGYVTQGPQFRIPLSPPDTDWDCTAGGLPTTVGDTVFTGARAMVD